MRHSVDVDHRLKTHVIPDGVLPVIPQENMVYTGQAKLFASMVRFVQKRTPWQ